MILALKIADLTDQLLANTLRAAERSAADTDWMTLAELQRLERQLLDCAGSLGYHVTVERRAA